MSSAEEWYRFAVILDHFHTEPDVFVRLTERQKKYGYLHSRDKNGAPRPPLGRDPLIPKKLEKESTLEEELAKVEELAKHLGPRMFPEQERLKTIRRLKEKYGGKR